MEFVAQLSSEPVRWMRSADFDNDGLLEFAQWATWAEPVEDEGNESPLPGESVLSVMGRGANGVETTSQAFLLDPSSIFGAWGTTSDRYVRPAPSVHETPHGIILLAPTASPGEAAPDAEQPDTPQPTSEAWPLADRVDAAIFDVVGGELFERQFPTAMQSAGERLHFPVEREAGTGEVLQVENGVIGPSSAATPESTAPTVDLGFQPTAPPARGQHFRVDEEPALSKSATRTCKMAWFLGLDGKSLHPVNPCQASFGPFSSAPFSPPELPAGLTVGSVTSDDANSDGLDDLAINSALDGTWLTYAVGDGTFHSDLQSLPTAGGDGQFTQISNGGVSPDSGGAPPNLLAVHDDDSDGLFDLAYDWGLVHQCGPGENCEMGSWCANGYLFPVANCAGHNFGSGALRGAFVDLDGDKRRELIVSDISIQPGVPLLLMIKQDDDGTPSISNLVLEEPINPLLVGDINDDGHTDIVFRPEADQPNGLQVLFGGLGFSGLVPLAPEIGQVDDAIIYFESNTWILGLKRLALLGPELAGTDLRPVYAIGFDGDGSARRSRGVRMPFELSEAFFGHFDPAQSERSSLQVLGPWYDLEGEGFIPSNEPLSGETYSASWASESGLDLPSSAPLSVVALPELGLEYTLNSLSTMADLDDDGVEQVVSWSSGDGVGSVAVLGGSPLQVQSRHPDLVENYVQDGALHYSRVVKVDLNGDSLDDFVVLAPVINGDTGIVVWPNPGDGTLDPELRYFLRPPEEADRPFASSLTLLGPADEELQLLVGFVDYPTHRWVIDLESQETLNWEALPEETAGGHLVTFDHDSDGVPDLAVGGPDGVSVLRSVATR
jgi:hypothetical protein